MLLAVCNNPSLVHTYEFGAISSKYFEPSVASLVLIDVPERKYRLLNKATAVLAGFDIYLAISKRRHIFREIIAK